MTTRISVPVTTVWSGADAPRTQDAPIVAPEPDPVAWNAALRDAPPSALHGRTVTQALLAEPVSVRSERDGWVEVILPWQPSSADPEGYPGWVPAAHVTDAEEAPYDQQVVVTRPVADSGATDVSYGTILGAVDADRKSVRVALPDGGIGSVDADAVAPVTAAHGVPEPAAMLDSARQFVGLRYLWGGTSGWGMDCSGFVHLVHRRFGVTVPRDAFDQILATSQSDTAAPGDLYFFTGRDGDRITHVGFVTNDAGADAAMLHAPDGDRLQHIEDGPMSAARRERLAAAGSFLTRAGH